MSENGDIDFTKIINNIISTAKNITETVIEKGNDVIKDYYPFYSWPPVNIYKSEDNSMIFEFGLPGFVKEDVKIEFEDDYLLLTCVLSNKYTTGGKEQRFRDKLKLEDIKNQKYFIPGDKFDRKNYTMHMKNGLLRLVFDSIDE